MPGPINYEEIYAGCQVCQIEVTDVEKDTTETYDLSKANWKGAWACMRNGLVHMWSPVGPNDPAIRTSGRIWKPIRKDK